MTAAPALRIRDLRVGHAHAELVHGIDLDIAPGERLGLIGESGSGKSLTAFATLGLLDEQLHASGSISIAGGPELLAAGEKTAIGLRGRAAAMVFQEPMTALNPLMRIGDQIAEVMLIHGTADRPGAKTRTLDLVEQVGLPDPARIVRSFPHQLSGGQRQRVVLAIALANDPALLIADEPTTALDVTVQAQVLGLMADLVSERGSSLLFISHDLAVVGSLVDRVAVMRHGDIVETGPAATVLSAPQHEYTRALVAASSLSPGAPGEAVGEHRWEGDEGPEPAIAGESEEPLIRVRDLRRVYRRGGFGRSREVTGLDGVSFDIAAGQRVGIVGESGSGKSTLIRQLCALDQPTSGRAEIAGTTLIDAEGRRAGRAEQRRVHQATSIVFQDPMSSLDPRMRVQQIVAEPLIGVPRAQAAARAAEALESVGLDASALDRFPHQFSGGQRQRIGIARALVTRPSILVADEPVSALDVSVRGQVLDLIAELAEQNGLTLLLISHDMGVIRHLCERVLVMSSGRIVESGPTEDVWATPQHPFTRRLIESTPTLAAVTGEPAPEEPA